MTKKLRVDDVDVRGDYYINGVSLGDSSSLPNYFHKIDDDSDDIIEGATNLFMTPTQETNFETAYTHSQIVTGNPHQLSSLDLTDGANLFNKVTDDMDDILDGATYVKTENNFTDLLKASLENVSSVVTNEIINGVPESEKSKWSVTYNATTRIFTLTISTDTFYVNASQVVEVSAGTYNSTAHANTGGIWFFYYNSSNVLTVTNSAWDLLEDIPIYLVYYNPNNLGTTPAGLLGHELHGCVMSASTHNYLHESNGSVFINGGGLAGYAIATDSVAGVTFSIDSALFFDEDILNVTDSVSDGVSYYLMYKGTDGLWNWTTNSLPFFRNETTGNIQYNDLVLGLTDLTANGEYVNYYIFFSNFDGSIGRRTCIIPSQTTYTTGLEAQEESIFDLNLQGFPTAEFVFYWKLTFERKNAYGATNGKAVLLYEPEIISTNSTSITGFTGEHNSLSGRSQLACHPAESVTYDNTTSGLTATNVQDAIDEIKALIDTLHP